MNFEFSDDALLIRDQARSFLRDRCGSAVVRNVIQGPELHASSLWKEIGEMGWLGVAIPETFGGTGLGYEVLCVLAEELGRVIAPVPFASSIYLAAEALLAAGSERQNTEHLPLLASGQSIGTFALAEGVGSIARNNVEVRAENGLLYGAKYPVPDGMIADMAIVVARDEHGIGLYVMPTAQKGVERSVLPSLDPSRGQARLQLNGAMADRLGAGGDHWPLLEHVLQRAAILVAFEQVGGAEACLHAARDYALERIIFGRTLASFQSIKHRLADLFVDIEIARSNAYYGAWALETVSAHMPRAAAAARLAAIEAFRIAAKENIQIHGGSGFTWEFDCHLFYRRAKMLALGLGGAPYWADRLIDFAMDGDANDGF